MADPFSLMGGASSPPSASPTPMARPSFFDQILGRGKYMEEFSTRRRDIIKQARQEKRRLGQQMQRDTREYELKLRRDNTKLYQEYNIKQSLRGNQAGLNEEEQTRVRAKAWRKIQKEMRKQRRAAERDIEHQRDRQIRAMRDSLREGTLPAPPGV